MNDSAQSEFVLRRAWALASLGELIQAARFDGLLAGPPLQNVQDSRGYVVAAQEFARNEQTPCWELEERLGLTPAEMNVLWFLTCLEKEPVLRELAGRLLHQTTGAASLELVDRLVHSTDDRVDLAMLVELGLAEIEASPNQPRFRRSIRPSDAFLEYVREGRWPAGVGVSVPCTVALEELVIDPDVVAACEAALKHPSAVVLVVGAVASGKLTMLSAAARRIGRALQELPGCDLTADSAELRVAVRNARLSGRVPVVTDLRAEQIDILEREVLRRSPGLVLVTSSDRSMRIRVDRPVIVIELPAMTAELRASLWKKSLPITDVDADVLADRYPIAPGLVVRASEVAVGLARGDKLAPCHVYDGIRAVLDDKLGAYAQRVVVNQTWDDLVLPQDQVEPIAELMARVRGRRRVYEQWGFAAKVGKGLGVAALFSGPPGTGKTMVAALIAKELGLELYQVDIAKLVSKYIGETEKHLAAMFDAAEAGHAILLFDECDSLFGRRTEVRSSNDRYANLETNYLLQRLESFTGICLLTTNHETNLDPAFHRRLSLHVRFDLPDTGERAKLWRAVLPSAAPVASDIDFAALAYRYEMSGGYIKNAALRAAFLAADEGAEITASHLEHAARVEYDALGKLTA